MPRQSRTQLIEHLRIQMGYLRKSAREFDDGDVSEAARLAVTIRVLLHNTNSSTSLLKQLGVQHQLRFLDTASVPEPRTPGVVYEEFSSGLGAIRLDNEGAHFVARLGGDTGADDGGDDKTHGRQLFRTWWNRRVLKDLLGHQFTRKELVLFLAHRLGGAHVDPKMSVRFAAMTEMNSLGWGWNRSDEGIALVVPAGPQDEPMGSAIPVNVRQIAYEVEESITRQLSGLLDGVPVNA